MTYIRPFRIDILDASGNNLGSGPLTEIVSIDTVERLDKIGELTFVIFANDPKAQYVTDGAQFDIYDETDGYIGRYLFNKRIKTIRDGRSTLVVQCWSILRELAYVVTGFAREYQYFPVQSIVQDLVASVDGWTSDVGLNMGITNVSYQGQTIYEGIEDLAKRWGYHFRLAAGSARVLEFNTLGELNENLRLVNLQGQTIAFDSLTDIGIVKSFTENISTDEIYNRVIAVGAGTGANMLVLEDGAVGDTYTVQSRTKSNGQTEYYIEDTASIASYGVRETVLIFDQIRPIANTVTSKSYARAELLSNAEAWLERYKDARRQYDDVIAYGVKTTVQVGDKISIRYKELDDLDNLYLNIDEQLWITELVVTRKSTGEREHKFKLVSIDRPSMNDQDIVASAVKGIRSEKLLIKPTTFRYSDTYTDFAANSNSLYDDRNATFTLTFDDTVTDLTRVVIEWRTKPIYCTSVWSSSGLTETNNANPTTPHKHTLNLATLATTGLFTILESSHYPTDISLEINGVNVDNHVDVDYLTGGYGEWNSGGTPDSALFVRMDITDFILNAAGGIYQTFEFKFILNTPRTRDTAVPYYTTNTPQNNSTGNQGLFELKILSQGVCQGVYKS